MNLLGRKFWTYRIDRVLGTGGSATVYQGTDERDGKQVAIKILPEGMDRGQVQRFKQEAKALSQLDHPKIIKIYDIGQAEGLCFYVMEYRPWKTLRELMDERFAKGAHGFTIEEILAVSRDVADALSCSHARRIYHRDIKPSNILITPEFQAVLCDFGLAKVSDEKTLTQVGTLMGTPLYMAPEQLQGGEVDGRADIYQLGLVLYQMATRAIPFAGDNPYVAATRRLHEPIPPPGQLRQDLPGGLEQIIVRCVERERRRRYQNANDLLGDIEQLSISLKRMRSEGDHTVIRRRGARRRWLVPAASAAAILLAVAGGWALLAGSGPTELRVSEFSLIPGRQEATVSFATDRPLRSEVLFGEGEEPDRRQVLSSEPSTRHRANLTGLSSGKRYGYRIRLFLEPDRMKELPTREFETTRGQ